MLFTILGTLIYFGVEVVPTIGAINTQSRQELVKEILDIVKEQDIIKEQDIVKDLAVCVIDAEPLNNKVYYNLPILVTQLVCDGPIASSRGKHSSLAELYGDGWSLLQIVDPSIEITEQKEISKGKEKTRVEQKRRAYVAIYLERTNY